MNVLTLPELAQLGRGELEIAIRSRVQTVYLGNRRVLCRVLGGPKLYLSTADVGFAGHVMLDGFWEIWLTQFFARRVLPGMIVADIGANFGYYTVLFGEAVGPTGRVVAVEPAPQTAELLRKSVQLNGHAARTEVVQAALGREASTQVHFHYSAEEPKNAMVVPAESKQTILVQSTSLDALTSNFDRLDLVKIDAEGGEFDIMTGMEKVIARFKPDVLLEFNAARYPDAAGFLRWLRERFAKVRMLGFDAELYDVADTELLSMRYGEDWLLFLEARR